MTNGEIFDFLDSRFPVETAMDFDNPGFLVGDRNAEVSRILVSLDCDRAAVDRAIQTDCRLIVTHHPVIFHGLKSVTSDTLVYRLIANEVSVISMHTNLDIAAGGVNECLCRAVGLTEITPYVAQDGFSLLCGRVAPQSADAFAKTLHERLGSGIRYTAGDGDISRILVCCGGGGDYLGEVRAAGCDALLTADVKHNVFVEAFNTGIALFDAGHYATEDVIVEPLAEMIHTAFPELSVEAFHSQPIKYG